MVAPPVAQGCAAAGSGKETYVTGAVTKNRSVTHCFVTPCIEDDITAVAAELPEGGSLENRRVCKGTAVLDLPGSVNQDCSRKCSRPRRLPAKTQ